MLQCDKCGKWFYYKDDPKLSVQERGIVIAPLHDCKYGGPTNPYQEKINQLENKIEQMADLIKYLYVYRSWGLSMKSRVESLLGEKIDKEQEIEVF